MPATVRSRTPGLDGAHPRKLRGDRGIGCLAKQLDLRRRFHRTQRHRQRCDIVVPSQADADARAMPPRNSTRRLAPAELSFCVQIDCAARAGPRPGTSSAPRAARSSAAPVEAGRCSHSRSRGIHLRAGVLLDDEDCATAERESRVAVRGYHVAKTRPDLSAAPAAMMTIAAPGSFQPVR